MAYEEKLAETIRKFPVLYDKSQSLYEYKNIVNNAWKEVANECGVETPAQAKKQFDNLKKCLSKRRRKAKGPSGASAAPVDTPKERLRELF